MFGGYTLKVNRQRCSSGEVSEWLTSATNSKPTTRTKPSRQQPKQNTLCIHSKNSSTAPFAEASTLMYKTTKARNATTVGLNIT